MLAEPTERLSGLTQLDAYDISFGAETKVSRFYEAVCHSRKS